MGIVSTPMVHWAVRRINRGLNGDEETYYQEFAKAYATALIGVPSGKQEKLIIDGANGVGAEKVTPQKKCQTKLILN
jgi:hypothetical protein